jgi:hypothetical protein
MTRFSFGLLKSGAELHEVWALQINGGARMDEPRMDKGKANDIKPGAIRHETSPPEFREQTEAVHRLIGRYLGQTLEEFKIGFMRDSRPEGEVAIWCRIATAWYEYHDRFLGGDRLPDDQEEKIVAALIAISAGEEDVHSLPVAAEVGARLLTYYEGMDAE